MRFHFLMVPVFGSAAAEGELNRFLANHRIIGVDRQLIASGPTSVWARAASPEG